MRRHPPILGRNLAGDFPPKIGEGKKDCDKCLFLVLIMHCRLQGPFFLGGGDKYYNLLIDQFNKNLLLANKHI